MSEYNLDQKSCEVLKSLRRRGGEASTPEIKADTGLTSNELHHRYEVLEDNGLIRLRKGEPDGTGGLPPKVASLTPAAEDIFKKGRLSVDNDQDTVELPAEKVEELLLRQERLERRLDALTKLDEIPSEDVDEMTDIERLNAISAEIMLLERLVYDKHEESSFDYADDRLQLAKSHEAEIRKYRSHMDE